MIDEGPSSEDIDRFARDTAFCPDCGEEVWDQAEVCPSCHAYLGGKTSSRLPVQEWFQKRWVVVIVLALLIAFMILFMYSRPAAN